MIQNYPQIPTPTHYRNAGASLSSKNAPDSVNSFLFHSNLGEGGESGSEPERPRFQARNGQIINKLGGVFNVLDKEKEPAGKPGSVVDSHSSGTRVTACLERPTREPHGPCDGSPIWPCSGWGLPCHRCYHRRGALLPHLFTLACAPPPNRPLVAATPRRGVEVDLVAGPSAVCFLWHFPSARAAQALPGTLPCGARTFLRGLRPGGCLADSLTQYIGARSEFRGQCSP